MRKWGTKFGGGGEKGAGCGMKEKVWRRDKMDIVKRQFFGREMG